MSANSGWRSKAPDPGPHGCCANPGALLDEWASSHTLEVYIPQRFHGWFQSPDGLRREIISALDRFGIPYASGENVTFFATLDGSPLMFRQQIGDACVASDVQLYLDLWAWPMRGKEQAIHLRKERLAY